MSLIKANFIERAEVWSYAFMSAVLKLFDEHFGSSRPERRPGGEIRLASERVTARDIIRRRVESEVAEVNKQRQAYFDGHARTRSFLIDVEPTSAEEQLNNPISRSKPARLFDLDVETSRALTAFQRRGIIMLVDDRQMEDLDDEIAVTPECEVVFVYLTPLKGG